MAALAIEFGKLAQERHDAGAKEYGEVGFLQNDLFMMIYEELADISNYCTYFYIKLRLLEEALKNAGINHPSGFDAGPSAPGTTSRLGSLDENPGL